MDMVIPTSVGMRSPRAWGWTEGSEEEQGGGVAFPTGVGMDRWMTTPGRSRRCVPHGRGDGPIAEIVSGGTVKRSPRAWGWTDHESPSSHTGRAFPTGVGMDRTHMARLAGLARVPHGRGDGPMPEECAWFVM